jgi:iron-sulfur cluster repair di-iron protein
MAFLHASPGSVINVRPLKECFANAKTKVLIETDALEVVWFVLPAGKLISEHQAPSETTFQVIEGAVQFTCLGQSHKLSAGEMLFLASREPHTVFAVEDSTVLLTMLMGRDVGIQSATVENWRQSPLTNLCDHIEQTHHAYLKKTLPALSSLIAKVVDLRGDLHEELNRLQTHFISWRDDIISGMTDEERSLFPAIRELEAQAHPPGNHRNFIAAMIRPIRFLHEDISEALKVVKNVSADPIHSPAGCPEFVRMHKLLRQVESDVRAHVQLEEDILFPRAIELEASVFGTNAKHRADLR